MVVVVEVEETLDTTVGELVVLVVAVEVVCTDEIAKKPATAIITMTITTATTIATRLIALLIRIEGQQFVSIFKP